MSWRSSAAAATVLRRFGKAGRLLGPDLDVALAAGAAGALRDRRERSRWPPGRSDLAVYRRIWDDAAAALGAEVLEQPGGYLRIRRGEASTLVWRNLVQLDDPVVLQLASDKPLVHRLLRRAGVPVAAHLEYDRRDLRPAARFLAERGGPVVVKPASRTGGGNGVTCGVRSPHQLTRASLRASRWDDRLLVEQQTEGREYRLLILDGELLGAVARRAPEVTGDGCSSVADLIRAENRRRADSDGLAGLFPVTIDLDCILALEARGLTLRSVPPPGRRVVVKTMVNEGGAAENETMTAGDLAPEVVAGCVAAARAVGVRLAGVEVVMSPRSAAAPDWSVLEVNGTPGLHYHYQVANRDKLASVGVPVLDTLLGRRRPVDHGGA